MRCPDCGDDGYTSYPKDHVAYYDRQFEHWAEALVYQCDVCGHSELMRQPLGTLLDNMPDVPDLGLLGFGREDTMQAFMPDDGPGLRAFKHLRMAREHEARGEHGQAAEHAIEFCRLMGEKLDVVWYAWAVSLAEKAGDEKLLKEARGLYLGLCLEYKKGLESRECAYKNDLLGILEIEIDNTKETK
jgi:hypothetical protein